MTPPTFLDLFCGCGGFSLGLERAGFQGLAALDFNQEAIATYRANFPNVPHILEKDLLQFPPQKLAELLGTTSVDVIIGGPPCQGFSTARQRDGANHDEARLGLALGLYVSGRLGFGRAAEVAGMLRPQFQQALAIQRLPMDYTLQDLAEDAGKLVG